MSNDLISRDYIVEVYNRVKVVCKNCDNYNGVRCRACDIGDELHDLQDIIDNAPTVTPQALYNGIVELISKNGITTINELLETLKGGAE